MNAVIEKYKGKSNGRQRWNFRGLCTFLRRVDSILQTKKKSLFSACQTSQPLSTNLGEFGSAGTAQAYEPLDTSTYCYVYPQLVRL
jgi:hypothetical protein